jgi:hypothetical protein
MGTSGSHVEAADSPSACRASCTLNEASPKASAANNQLASPIPLRAAAEICFDFSDNRCGASVEEDPPSPSLRKLLPLRPLSTGRPWTSFPWGQTGHRSPLGRMLMMEQLQFLPPCARQESLLDLLGRPPLFRSRPRGWLYVSQALMPRLPPPSERDCNTSCYKNLN